MFHIKYIYILITLEIYYFLTFTQVKVIQIFTCVQESATCSMFLSIKDIK